MIFFFLVEAYLLRWEAYVLGEALFCHALQYRTYFREKHFQFSVVEKRTKTYHSVSDTMVMTLSQL